MKNNKTGSIIILIAIYSFVMCSNSYSDSIYSSNLKQELRDNDLREHNNRLRSGRNIKSVSGLVENSFPAVPTNPVYTFTAESDEEFNVAFWREQLSDGSYLPFVRITPLTANPTFICGASFEVIARTNFERYGLGSSEISRIESVKLVSDDDSSFCGDLTEPTTFMWAQWSFDDQYDRDQAFIMIHDWNDQYMPVPYTN